MLILGIETSCDDTGIAILEVAPTKVGVVFNILSNTISSQIKTHAPFGGVVPNLAAREHLKNITPCLKTAINEANIAPKDIDLIAVTVGPGLIPSLLIGVNFARALAYAWEKPIVAVNHIEAHILASIFNFPQPRQAPASTQRGEKRGGQFSIFKKSLPAIALVVSGGHTQLVLVKDIGKYKIIGETRDDAAGECFDKVAKLLRLGYPGGPIIAAQAAKLKVKSSREAGSRYAGQKLKVNLPRPMMNQKNYDFSFSGLKTAVLYLLKDIEKKYHIFSDRTKSGINIIPELCCEVQQAIIDVLIEKTLRAAKEYKAKTIILSGGVAANEELRKQFTSNIKHQTLNINFLTPLKTLCTDNGAMIAIAGYLAVKRDPDFGRGKSWQKINADANLRIN